MKIERIASKVLETGRVSNLINYLPTKGMTSSYVVNDDIVSLFNCLQKGERMVISSNDSKNTNNLCLDISKDDLTYAENQPKQPRSANIAETPIQAAEKQKSCVNILLRPSFVATFDVEYAASINAPQLESGLNAAALAPIQTPVTSAIGSTF